jgi:DNA polymerase II small subunit/DNA polymerase delta subunit B
MVPMERGKIIKTFLEKGFQLDSKSLNYFSESPEKLDAFFEKIQGMSVPSTINIDFVNSLTEANEIEVLKKFDYDTSGKTLVVESITKFFSNRYDSLKKYFSGRLELVNLISINKITPKTKKFSLIVMVKEKNANSLLVEDFTGEETVCVCVLDEDVAQVVSDEIVGIVCEKKNDAINVKKIIFPDIPLKREVPRTEDDVYALFLSDLFLDKSDISNKILEKINSLSYKKLYIFLLGNISSKKEDITNFLNSLPKDSIKIFLKGDLDPQLEGDNNFSSPAVLVRLEDKILVLICSGKLFSEYKNIWKEQPSENIMLNLLKKRHLSPVFNFNKKFSDEDTFIIDTIPDIFVSSNFNGPGTTNYKGTTIISNGSFLSEPIYYLINLRTRETIKINFP